jgi:hypothetical protein
MASALAEKLGKDRIFYDRWHEAELTRPDADVYLFRIYNDSRLIVVFKENITKNLGFSRNGMLFAI